MRRINVLFGIAAACFALSACGSQTSGSAEGIDVPAVVDASGVKFDMVAVEGGSFAMGKTPAGTKIADVTIHEVVLDGFSISGKPVSRQLWEAVMNEQRGSSSSVEAPVDMVSQEDCKKFISKLSKMTGIPFSSGNMHCLRERLKFLRNSRSGALIPISRLLPMNWSAIRSALTRRIRKWSVQLSREMKS